MKNFNDTTGNRTRDLTDCNALPQPTAPPRDPYFMELSKSHQINSENITTNIMVFCDVNIATLPAIREHRVLMNTMSSVLSDNLPYTLSKYRIQNSALLDLLIIFCHHSGKPLTRNVLMLYG
jgi:hypothetical protein